MSSKVSVLVPSYNYGSKLPLCIESVLAQDYPNFELVISDDASTDDSEQVIRSYRDPRLVYEAQAQNRGMVPNWRRCVELSTGDYLLLLGADDYLKPGMLSRCAGVLDSDSEIAFCHTATEFFTSEGVIVATTGAFQRSYVRPGAELVESFLRGKRVVNSSSMFRRSLFEAVGGWSSDYRNCMDIDLWYRLMLHRKVGYIGSILVGFRSHSITDGWTTLLVDEHIDWLRNAFALLPPSLRHLREIEEDVIAMYSARGARALGHLPATEERVRVISKLQAQPGSEGVRSTLDHWYQRAMQAVRPRATVLAAKLPERARHTIGDLARMRFPFR